VVVLAVDLNHLGELPWGALGRCPELLGLRFVIKDRDDRVRCGCREYTREEPLAGGVGWREDPVRVRVQVLRFQAPRPSKHTRITGGEVVVQDTAIQFSAECTRILPDFPRSPRLKVFGRVTLIIVILEFIVINVPSSRSHCQSTFV